MNLLKDQQERDVKKREQEWSEREALHAEEINEVVLQLDKYKGQIKRLEAELDEMHNTRNGIKQLYEDEILDLKYQIEHLDTEILK